MGLIVTAYEHIFVNDKGVPEVGTSNMKGVELITEHQAFGWSPEELYFNHPYLTLGQIYSALAYYWDHKAELDAEIG